MADQLQAGKELCDKRANSKTFECCKSKLVGVTVCIKCGNAFHKSSVERKRYHILDETRIVCCSEKQSKNIQGYVAVGQQGESSSQGTNVDSNINNLLMEIDLLRKLIVEKDAKYEILWENKMLLDEKVMFLTKTNKNLSTDKNTNKEKNTTTNKNNISQLEYPNTTKTTDPNVGQSHIIKYHK
ncbi:hypothetical protein JTB14_034061 [Gonioctena quinquepunctata]|nr:hypothetical protein JTB14_034061 [Gonioctena quinquepunctata]